MENKIDYKTILNNYWHHGYSKDWLKGYVQCLCTNKLITFKEGMFLTCLIEQCKR